MMYAICPGMTFRQAVAAYASYASQMRKQKRQPVSFLNFITGRL